MGRKAVDTRKFNKVGTRKLFGRILIVFMLVTVVSAGLLGRIAYLGKAKGAEAEKKSLPSRATGAMRLNIKEAISQTGMGISWQSAERFTTLSWIRF